MIKLLLITNRYPAHKDDGASPFVADFVAGLRRNDIACTVLTPYHYADRYDEDESIIRFEWGEKERTIGSLPKFHPGSWKKIQNYLTTGYREAEKLHRIHHFDFCFALWAAPSGIFARKLNEQFGLPYAVWCLGSDIHTYARLPVVGKKIIDVLTASDFIYSDGHALGKEAEALSGCPYHFLPSMRRLDIPHDIETPERQPLLLCPGRVEKAKGVFDLLEAFRMVADRFMSWSLCYIGDGPARSKLQAKINSYGLDNRVITPGFLTRDEMTSRIVQSAAVVIPTRADSLPLTFGEAMQLKRPVIVTDVGDLKYFTQKYGVGLVVPPAAPDRLSQAIADFIDRNKNFTSGFDDCVRELDIDLAADRFAGWLRNHLMHKEKTREMVSC